MNKNIFAILFLLSPVNGAWAQESEKASEIAIPQKNESSEKAVIPEKPDNLASHAGAELLGGIGLATRYSSLYHRRMTEFGLRGFLSLHQWAIGFAGYRTASDRRAPEPFRDYMLEVDTRSLFIEYLTAPQKLVHLNIALAIGNGEVSYANMNDHDNMWDAKNDFYLFYEPEIELEVNFAEFVKGWVGISHQFVQGVGIIGLTNKDIERTMIQVGVKIGQF